jgi:hypothetical protein
VDRRARLKGMHLPIFPRLLRHPCGCLVKPGGTADRRPTYDGWLWLEGYVLNNRGRAVQRRRIFVRQNGLFFSASA